MTDRAEQIRASRDREQQRAIDGKVGRLPNQFDTSVVGVSFAPSYPHGLHLLEEMWLEAQMKDEPLVAVLVRNPANEFDANAIQVHVPALGEIGWVGHITKSLAARLAPELDADINWLANVGYVKIHEDHPERPGLEIHLQRKT